MKFLIDEDMPRSLAPALRAAKYDAHDSRDVGLGGKPDDVVFAHAVAEGMTLISEDMGFANLVTFELGTHPGIMVARFPSTTPTWVLNQAIVSALATLSESEIDGSLVIVEPARIRLRTKIT